MAYKPNLALDDLIDYPRISNNKYLNYIKANAVKTDGGRMRAEDLRNYIKETFNIEYTLRNIYWLLHSLGFSWITSRSKHPKQSKETQDAFKKLQAGNDHSHPI